MLSARPWRPRLAPRVQQKTTLKRASRAQRGRNMLKERDETGGLPLADFRTSYQAVVAEGVRPWGGRTRGSAESGTGATHRPDFHPDAKALAGERPAANGAGCQTTRVIPSSHHTLRRTNQVTDFKMRVTQQTLGRSTGKPGWPQALAAGRSVVTDSATAPGHGSGTPLLMAPTAPPGSQASFEWRGQGRF